MLGGVDSSRASFSVRLLTNSLMNSKMTVSVLPEYRKEQGISKPDCDDIAKKMAC